jgi:hypothetical protein
MMRGFSSSEQPEFFEEKMYRRTIGSISNIIYLVRPSMLAIIHIHTHSVKRLVVRNISGYITTASLAEF